VLFYQALWVLAAGAGRGAVLGGAACAAVLLAVIATALFKYSLRLPLGPFFNAMSGLLALLAVVFAGHGVAALQEAGVIGARQLGFQPLPILGIYPSVEALSAQILALALVAFGFWAARRSNYRGTTP
jgi:high-affinity iron transporter